MEGSYTDSINMICAGIAYVLQIDRYIPASGKQHSLYSSLSLCHTILQQKVRDDYERGEGEQEEKMARMCPCARPTVRRSQTTSSMI